MITVKNVNKQFGTYEVLKDINFSIGEDEIVGFLGINGAGKTTMLRILTSYLSPSEGEVSINGFDVKDKHLEVRRSIGYLPENPPLYYSMRVNDYLKFAACLKDVASKDINYQVDKAISQCYLGDVKDKLIGVLSKGFRQRVGLAQAILNDPKVLILDEPTSGLDPIQVKQVHDLFNELKRGRTVILSTHALAEIEKIAQRILILKDKTIVLDQSIDEIKANDQSLEEDQANLQMFPHSMHASVYHKYAGKNRPTIDLFQENHKFFHNF